MAILAALSSANTERAPDCTPRRLVASFPNVELNVVRFERNGSTAVPYVVVRGVAIPAFERALNSDPKISGIQQLERTEDAAFYKAVWDVDCPIIQCMADANGTIVRARGTMEEWHLKVWFETRRDASAFHDCCIDRDIPLTVQRLLSLDDYLSETGTGISRQQKEALMLASQQGYFDEPRRVSQEDLAEELDISSSAVSSRLRRGIRTIVGETLM